MFKKILQSLSKSQSAKVEAPRPAVVPASALASRAMPGAVPPPPAAAFAAAIPETPEALCEVSPRMPKDQIQAQIKLLYRRYNRSASSLDPKVRSEAEKMLNAIVLVREKHFGTI